MKENSLVQEQTINEQDKTIKTLNHLVKNQDTDTFNTQEYIQKQFQNSEREKLRAEEDADFYQNKCNSLASEILELQGKLEQAEFNKIKYTSLKSEYDELIDKIHKHEETIKVSNQRFSQLIKKIDHINQEKKGLDLKNSELENEKKKLLERWQQ